MTTWTGILTIANLVIAISIVIGGYIAIRSTMARAGQDIQDRVRQALHDENELLQSRLKRLELENKRLGRQLQLVIDMLKKIRGIELDVTDDMVTLRDASGVHVSRLHTTDGLGA